MLCSFFLLFLQAKNRTNAPGKVVNGVLRAAMNWRVIIANTLAPSRSSVATVIAVSHVPIIWRCTWNATCKFGQTKSVQENHLPKNPRENKTTTNICFFNYKNTVQNSWKSTLIKKQKTSYQQTKNKTKQNKTKREKYER